LQGVIPIRKWIIACILLVIAAVLLAGCLGTRSTAVTSAAPPAMLVDYHRTGGIAGVDDRLVIFDNGEALVSTQAVTGEFTVNQSELSRIEDLFEASGFGTLEGNYTARHGADLMRYRIAYQNKTVVTEDTAVPSPLRPVISEMNAILGSGSARNFVPESLAGIRA
jgi:hypothetical protein